MFFLDLFHGHVHGSSKLAQTTTNTASIAVQRRKYMLLKCHYASSHIYILISLLLLILKSNQIDCFINHFPEINHLPFIVNSEITLYNSIGFEAIKQQQQQQQQQQRRRRRHSVLTVLKSIKNSDIEVSPTKSNSNNKKELSYESDTKSISPSLPDNTNTNNNNNINIINSQSNQVNVVQEAVASLASTILALLAGNSEAASILAGNASDKRDLINTVFSAYDNDGSGMLNRDQAKSLFSNLSRSIVVELAKDERDIKNNSKNTAARAHAGRVLAEDEAGNTIERVATKLLLLADDNSDGLISLTELAGLFDAVHKATATSSSSSSHAIETFPQPLRALAGSLQLLPKTEGVEVTKYDTNQALEWGIGVPGDDHTLRCVRLDQNSPLSIIGLGRSADASAYFIPELSIVFDAGIQVKSIIPKTVLVTHGHRDHIAALPTMAAQKATIFTPKPISNLVEKFLLSEAQLNYGDDRQTDEETIQALGKFDIRPVVDCDDILLDRSRYSGSPTPIGIQVIKAPHKDGVPAVSYGIYRVKNRLKHEYASLPKNKLGALLRKKKNLTITESYKEGILFYTGDTKIELLRTRYTEILPFYKYIIHEVTFLGQPSTELDISTEKKGHTHYAQLHPWICAFPETTFICVHWSLRYSKQDVLNFFEVQYGGVPKNVVLWV